MTNLIPAAKVHLRDDIDTFTLEEEAQLDAIASKWIEYGLQAGKYDLDVQREGIVHLYSQAKLGVPIIVQREWGPYSICVADAIIRAGQRDGLSREDAIARATDEAVASGECDRALLREAFTVRMGGRSLAHRPAWWETWIALGYRKVIEMQDDIQAATAAGSGGFMIWRDGYVLCGCLPSELHLNEDGQLHNTTGPAIAYPDGWRAHYVNGVEIPDEWIERPETLTAKVALAWENMDQRSVAVSLLGWEAILGDLDATEIASDEWGTLLEAQVPDHGRQRFVRTVCATGRPVVLLVDDSATTPLAAIARSYGVPPAVYAQIEVRT